MRQQVPAWVAVVVVVLVIAVVVVLFFLTGRRPIEEKALIEEMGPKTAMPGPRGPVGPARPAPP